MMQFDQWVLPDGEAHLPSWMTTTGRRVGGRLTYQYSKYEAALKRCKQRRRAVDVGSHVGLWAYWMARDFRCVECFEPKPEHAWCWERNMATRDNATLHQVALGREAQSVGLITGPSSSGDTAIDPASTGTPMVTLDSFGFEDVDFLKIDCEGYEAFVIEGAVETIARCSPTVIVEQKPGHGQRFGRGEKDAVYLLVAMGARQEWEHAGDFVLVFP